MDPSVPLYGPRGYYTSLAVQADTDPHMLVSWTVGEVVERLHSDLAQTRHELVARDEPVFAAALTRLLDGWEDLFCPADDKARKAAERIMHTRCNKIRCGASLTYLFAGYTQKMIALRRACDEPDKARRDWTLMLEAIKIIGYLPRQLILCLGLGVHLPSYVTALKCAADHVHRDSPSVGATARDDKAKQWAGRITQAIERWNRRAPKGDVQASLSDTMDVYAIGAFVAMRRPLLDSGPGSVERARRTEVANGTQRTLLQGIENEVEALVSCHWIESVPRICRAMG